jgi:hypothetical protein
MRRNQRKCLWRTAIRMVKHKKSGQYATYRGKLRADRIAKLSHLKGLFGGKCGVCGYNRCSAALDFHHIDPSQKKFVLSQHLTRAMPALIAEAMKCELLCANCHRERHAAQEQAAYRASLVRSNWFMYE